jgi:WD and tetratricopeptide repeat-containing protein 1
MGHCNVQTDIKEAVFLGEKDELVACGSDDGRVFIYSAETGRMGWTL